MRYILAVFGIFLLAAPASADLIQFSISPSALESPAGGIYQPQACQNLDGSGACVIFDGTVTFTDDQDWFLTSLDVNMDPSNPDGGSQVFANDGGNYFLLFGPSVLGPDGPTGSSYTGGLFEVDVFNAAQVGAYFGSATLNYTDANSDTFSSKPVRFEVDVIAPEPGTCFLFSVAAVPWYFRRRRSR